MAEKDWKLPGREQPKEESRGVITEVVVPIAAPIIAVAAGKYLPDRKPKKEKP